MGTALIGVLLLVGIFGGLTTSLESSSISGNMTTEQVQNSLVNTWKKCRPLPTEHTTKFGARSNSYS